MNAWLKDILSRSRFSSKLVAWLALLAVVLLLFATFISKQLVAHGLMTVPMVSLSERGDEMPAMSVMDDMPADIHCAIHQTSHPAARADSVAVDAMQEMACGYCQLLIHLPFVLLYLVAQLLLLFILISRNPAVRLCCVVIERVWLRQPARDPPFFAIAIQ